MRLVCAGLIVLSLLCSGPLFAEEVAEKAGIGIGLTAGNMWFVPVKAISVSMGLASGILSFLATGGDMEVAGQAVRNSIEGPYLITPKVARMAVGERPELKEK
ncbi:MAG: hypothetical protein ACREP8_08125 [Candidatus Binatia bacterium]